MNAAVDQLVARAAKHRAVLPARLTTIDGREVVVERLNDTRVRFGIYVFDAPEGLDGSIALAHAAQPPRQAGHG